MLAQKVKRLTKRVVSFFASGTNLILFAGFFINEGFLESRANWLLMFNDVRRPAENRRKLVGVSRPSHWATWKAKYGQSTDAAFALLIRLPRAKVASPLCPLTHIFALFTTFVTRRSLVANGKKITMILCLRLCTQQTLKQTYTNNGTKNR